MEMTVDAIAEEVIIALKAAGYADSTIGQYRKSIRSLRAFAESRGGVYTEEIGAEFAGMTTSPRTGRFSRQRELDYGRITRVFNSVLATGKADLSVCKRGRSVPEAESAVHSRLVSSWHADMESRGLKESTRDYYGRLATAYLVFLENLGIDDVAEAEPETIPEFLKDLRSGTWANTPTYSIISNFRPFLAFLGRSDLMAALSMMAEGRPRNIMPSLGEGDVAKVIQACSGGEVPAKDAAVTLLALVTGMRAVDIIGLRLGDLDWRNKCIVTTQSKTGNPLTLPLAPMVGNAICDYVLEERPEAEDDHVFLRSVAPHTALSNHSAVYDVIRRTFSAAGASMTACGTRLLRHNAASSLVRAGTPLPTVSALLGHADPDSSKVYISADEKTMAMCVLPLPKGLRHAG